MRPYLENTQYKQTQTQKRKDQQQKKKNNQKKKENTNITKRAGRVFQMVEHLLSKHKALSSNSSNAKRI
jgi:hypothetical protein